MVDVCGMRRRGDEWFVDKTIRCSEESAKEYVKMLFDLGYEKVLVR